MTELNNTNLSRIKSILDNSGIIVFPTETVWGIGCKFDDESAVKKLYDIKGRDFNNPLQIQVSGFEMIRKFSSELISDKMNNVLSSYLPGPLSIVIKKNDVPNYITANLNTVSFRYSNIKEISNLVSYLGYPIASSSCNKSGTPVLENINEILRFSKLYADVLLNLKVEVGNISSTIIKIENENIKLLREGSLKFEEIESRLKNDIN